ncbi:MAG: hypothetical protein IPH31_24040 [Lewinellaceae bacterium]|nr:hypothetical protein [Lewinellaceae bacterium]
MNFTHLFRATIWLFLAFVRAAWHFRWRAMRSLDLPEGFVLNSKEKRRFKHYFYGASYLAVLICGLRKQTLSRRETHLFTNLSALAFSFDDLVEDVRNNADPSVLWQNNPEVYGLASDQHGLATHLLQNIYQALPEERLEHFRAYMHRVFNVETGGKKGYWNIEELKKIMAEKGGNSILLFRSVLNHPLTEQEEKAFYQFGCLFQYCDDIFDLWHDRQAGTVTLASFLCERAEIELLIKIFEEQVAATNLAFRKTEYALARIETALNAIHYLVSVTRMCLQYYLDLKRKNGTLPLDNRTAIVVDMEIWANRFEAIRYLLRPIP